MKVGVIGAGVMGCGVAQSAALAKHDVTLIDVSEDKLRKSKETIYNNLRFQSLYDKQVMKSIDEVISGIVFTTDYEQLKDAEVVIENVNEIWEVKKEVYEKLDQTCDDSTIFLANTSCISITKLASLLRRPSQLFGVHFMNPIYLKNTIEGIRGYHTSEETIEKSKRFLETLGKKCIVVEDYPGFVSNRISHLYMNEAAYVVQDQVTDPATVDLIFKECFGHKMGPLETADLIGLDTVVNSLDILYQSYQDSKFRCAPLLRKMVDAGLLGRKSDKGFYTY